MVVVQFCVLINRWMLDVGQGCHDLPVQILGRFLVVGCCTHGVGLGSLEQRFP
jgi:hypothetical protein